MIISVVENTWAFWMVRISHSCWHWPRASLFPSLSSPGVLFCSMLVFMKPWDEQVLAILETLATKQEPASDEMLRGHGSQEGMERAKGFCSIAICFPATLWHMSISVWKNLAFLWITFSASNGRVGLSYSYVIYDIGWSIYITLWYRQYMIPAPGQNRESPLLWNPSSTDEKVLLYLLKTSVSQMVGRKVALLKTW